MEASCSSSSSSLSTTISPSSTPPSSSASLHLPSLLYLADENWFYRSVLPLPSISLPCLPSLVSASPPPDPSTLLAQCMMTHLTSSKRLHPSSSPDLQAQTLPSPWVFPSCDAFPELSDRQETYGTTVGSYDEDAYRDENETNSGGYSTSLSDSDGAEDEYAYRGYSRGYAGDDEEAYHYYTATSDWEDGDAYYHMHSDCEDDQMKKEMLLTDSPDLNTDVEPEDVLSGIYDVGALLKYQHEKRTQEALYPSFVDSKIEAAPLVVSVCPRVPPLSLNEQGDIKENIRQWAHTVASTLPWKAAAQARPFL